MSSGALTELLTAAGTPTAAPDATAAAAAPLSVERARAVRKEALAAVTVPQAVVDVLVDLRTFMQETLEPPSYVSDRRLVKAVAVMQVRMLPVLCLCLFSVQHRHRSADRVPAHPQKSAWVSIKCPPEPLRATWAVLFSA